MTGRQRVSRILNHFQIVTSGKLQDRGHITWLAPEVDRNNCLRSWSNGAFDLFGIKIQSIGLTVHEYRIGLEIKHDFGRRGEGHRRHDDVVALLDPDRIQRQMKGRGSGIHRNGMLRANIPSKILFEALDFGTGGQPSGPECLDDRLNLSFTNRRPMKGDELRTHKRGLLELDFDELEKTRRYRAGTALYRNAD